MSNPVAQCAHVKTNGEVCGSPAVSGTEFCYHHSAIQTALGRVQPKGKAANGAFSPIPFVFPEDRAAMQINFFLLLQAFNEQRIDLRTYNCFLGLLRSMARNLGKSGSLTKDSDPRSTGSDQKNRERGTASRDREEDSVRRSEVSDQKDGDQKDGDQKDKEQDRGSRLENKLPYPDKIWRDGVWCEFKPDGKKQEQQPGTAR